MQYVRCDLWIMQQVALLFGGMVCGHLVAVEFLEDAVKRSWSSTAPICPHMLMSLVSTALQVSQAT